MDKVTKIILGYVLYSLFNFLKLDVEIDKSFNDMYVNKFKIKKFPDWKFYIKLTVIENEGKSSKIVSIYSNVKDIDVSDLDMKSYNVNDIDITNVDFNKEDCEDSIFTMGIISAASFFTELKKHYKYHTANAIIYPEKRKIGYFKRKKLIKNYENKVR